jgi:recA bacterial DNA recombination protein
MGVPIESSPPPGWEREGIDSLLGMFPPGRLSEIVGPRSSGASSLLLALIARITTSGRGEGSGQVAFVDGVDALDAASTAAAGADLSALLWVRCGGRLRVALSAADLLARCPGFALVVLDLDELGPVPASAYIRLQRAVEGTSTTLIVRSERHREGTPASLVLATRRLAPQWMGLRPLTRLAGLRSEISIARSRLHSLSPLGRGLQGEGLQGEGSWTLDWTLSQ